MTIFFKVHKHFFENPTFNLNKLCNSLQRWRVFLYEFRFEIFFMRKAAPKMRASNSSLVPTFFFNFALHPTQQTIISRIRES